MNPYPVSSGKDVVLSGIVDYWVDRVGADNVHYVLVRPQGEQVEAERFPVALHRLDSASSARRLWSVASRSLTGRSSLQESMLYSPKLGGEIARVVDHLDVDVVVFDTVRLGQYARFLPFHPGRRHVAYLDDLFSVRYAGMLSALERHRGVDVDALGQFRAFIPRRLLPLAQARLAQRALLTWERRLIDKAERASVSDFDKVLLINGLEAEALRTATGSDRVDTLPPLLPLTATPRPTYDGRPEFVFVGQLNIPHNDDGINWFLEEAMAPLLRALPEARLRIIGRDPRHRLLANAARFGDHVRLEGYVDNLDDALGRAAAMISPLRFGSGVKIKLVEALARGLPSVTTTIGAHGVVTDAHCGVLVEDDIKAYPRLLWGLTDPRFNRVVSGQAEQHFGAHFAPGAVRAQYDAVFFGSAQPSASAVRDATPHVA